MLETADLNAEETNLASSHITDWNMYLRLWDRCSWGRFNKLVLMDGMKQSIHLERLGQDPEPMAETPSRGRKRRHKFHQGGDFISSPLC